MSADERIADERAELVPWKKLVRKIDRNGVNLAVWNAPLLPERRVRWRTRLLSESETGAIKVRGIEDPSEVRSSEWIFTSGARNKRLEERGFAFWNMGHPKQAYKRALGARLVERSVFLKRWLGARDSRPDRSLV